MAFCASGEWSQMSQPHSLNPGTTCSRCVRSHERGALDPCRSRPFASSTSRATDDASVQTGGPVAGCRVWLRLSDVAVTVRLQLHGLPNTWRHLPPGSDLHGMKEPDVVDGVGPKGSVKRASGFLQVPVHGATQIESAGGVTKSMLDFRKAGLGPVAMLVGLGSQKAFDAARAQGDAEPGQPIGVPRHAVLAVTSDSLHIIAASDAGRIKKGAPTITIPLAAISAVLIEERKVATGFRVELTQGQYVVAETKRIGANRHNIDVLRLLQSRL